jgi:hypothetical protein
MLLFGFESCKGRRGEMSISFGFAEGGSEREEYGS